MIWLTGDTHFGHGNIIKYCSRPFSTASRMDAEIVDRWNTLVKPTDEVWHLGDFAWWKLPVQDVVDLRTKLNGDVHLVLGNHDRGADGFPTPAVLAAFPPDRLHDYAEIRVNGVGERTPLDSDRGRRAVLFHYAVDSWQSSHTSVHFHGHSHGKAPICPGRLDVGVDCTGFAPLAWAEAVAASRRGYVDRGGF